MAFDGLADPGQISESSNSIRYCGQAWTLGGELGWKIPIEFSYSCRVGDEAITYELSIGADKEYWLGLSEKKRWEKLYLLRRGELREGWDWAFSVSGEVPLGHADN